MGKQNCSSESKPVEEQQQKTYVEVLPVTVLFGGAALLGCAFCAVYKAGVDVAKRVLRRHDKDTRISDRKARKEAKRLEKERKKYW